MYISDVSFNLGKIKSAENVYLIDLTSNSEAVSGSRQKSAREWGSSCAGVPLARVVCPGRLWEDGRDSGALVCRFTIFPMKF